MVNMSNYINCMSWSVRHSNILGVLPYLDDSGISYYYNNIFSMRDRLDSNGVSLMRYDIDRLRIVRLDIDAVVKFGVYEILDDTDKYFYKHIIEEAIADIIKDTAVKEIEYTLCDEIVCLTSKELQKRYNK